jgi:hypothetical protein
MLRSLKGLIGADIRATDGDIGKVHDFYFDDEKWTVRYLVADTGGWLRGKLVLLSPAALGHPGWDEKVFPVHCTRQQVEDSPSALMDQPVSRQHEEDLHKHYGWPPYWIGGGHFPATTVVFGPERTVPPLSDTHGVRRDPDLPAEKGRGDPHLHSVKEVAGYQIQAEDEEIGHAEDFLVDDDSWEIRYLVVDTRRWLPGKDVLIAREWMDHVSYPDSRVHVDLTREQIRSAPEYEQGTPVSREYEEELYAHYGRRGYWAKEGAERRLP